VVWEDGGGNPASYPIGAIGKWMEGLPVNARPPLEGQFLAPSRLAVCLPEGLNLFEIPHHFRDSRNHRHGG